jgi:hypothetical protein
MRDLRRHHRERLMCKRANYYGGCYKGRAWRLVNTPTPCSCAGCGNPRRHWKGEDKLTIHERAELERDNQD